MNWNFNRAIAPHRLTRRKFLGLGVLAGLILASCNPRGNRNAATDNQPLVVSTSTILTDLTEQIGGDAIRVKGILRPGDDPHVYEPVPADTVAFEQADLILYNGYNLEPGIIRLINSAGVNAQKLAVGEVVPPLAIAYDSQQVADPHVWGSVANVILMVEAIRDALSELTPADQQVFSQNADSLIQRLTRLHQWISGQISTIPAERRRLVTTHDAFQYYAQAYGLEVIGTLIGISTEEQPSAQTVQTLVESIKNAGVPTIFAETTINPQLITTVAEEAGVALSPQALYSDSIGAKGSPGDSYINMMVSNTKAIVEALGGQYTAFE